jgi:hypothetical protein
MPLKKAVTSQTELKSTRVLCQSQSHVTTDGQSVSQSVSMSLCQVHSGTCDQMLLSV